MSQTPTDLLRRMLSDLRMSKGKRFTFQRPQDLTALTKKENKPIENWLELED